MKLCILILGFALAGCGSDGGSYVAAPTTQTTFVIYSGAQYVGPQTGNVTNTTNTTTTNSNNTNSNNVVTNINTVINTDGTKTVTYTYADGSVKVEILPIVTTPVVP